MHSLCGRMDCVVPSQMELLGAGQEPDSALPKSMLSKATVYVWEESSGC